MIYTRINLLLGVTIFSTYCIPDHIEFVAEAFCVGDLKHEEIAMNVLMR